MTCTHLVSLLPIFYLETVNSNCLLLIMSLITRAHHTFLHYLDGYYTAICLGKLNANIQRSNTYKGLAVITSAHNMLSVSILLELSLPNLFLLIPPYLQ